jgi:hypothetical protein
LVGHLVPLSLGAIGSTKAIAMSAGPIPESPVVKGRFTDLFPRITEEDDGYVCSIGCMTVQQHNGVADLAANFAYHARITLEIRIHHIAENTWH